MLRQGKYINLPVLLGLPVDYMTLPPVNMDANKSSSVWTLAHASCKRSHVSKQHGRLPLRASAKSVLYVGVLGELTGMGAQTSQTLICRTGRGTTNSSDS